MSVQAWEIQWPASVPAARERGFQAAHHRRESPRSTPTPDSGVFRAELSGFEEVPPINTGAHGSFEARIAPDGNSIAYTLTFADLSSPSTAAHLHFAPPAVNGEVFAFLCGGDSKPPCPGEGGTISGTITADDIRAIPSQGLEAGDLESAIRIIRAGLAYVNVHSTRFPAGEIRAQVR